MCKLQRAVPAFSRARPKNKPFCWLNIFSNEKDTTALDFQNISPHTTVAHINSSGYVSLSRELCINLRCPMDLHVSAMLWSYGRAKPVEPCLCRRPCRCGTPHPYAPLGGLSTRGLADHVMVWVLQVTSVPLGLRWQRTCRYVTQICCWMMQNIQPQRSRSFSQPLITETRNLYCSSTLLIVNGVTCKLGPSTYQRNACSFGPSSKQHWTRHQILYWTPVPLWRKNFLIVP